jgi:hypothetical protein
MPSTVKKLTSNTASISYRGIGTNLIVHVQEEVIRYKKLHDDILIERNKFKQQCTQV